MAKLRFLARDDGPDGPLLVTIPGSRPMQGQPPRYVGRVLQKTDAGPAFVATAEPFECDSETDIGRRLLERIANDVRDGYGAPVHPADAETAAACGLEFKGPRATAAAGPPARVSAPNPSRTNDEKGNSPKESRE